MKKIIINITTGSDFQTEMIRNMLVHLLNAWEARHKKNGFNIEFIYKKK